MKHVAMIFDDGPEPTRTEQILAICGGRDVRVTFGQVAKHARANPELVTGVTDAGHEIANHSYSHQHPKLLDDAGLAKEVLGAQRIFANILGVKPAWYWPPYLEKVERLYALAGSVGLALFEPKHLVISGDHMRELPAEEIRTRAATGVADGSVILFHEWRDETIRVLPEVLDQLRSADCVFHTFSELASVSG